MHFKNQNQIKKYVDLVSKKDPKNISSFALKLLNLNSHVKYQDFKICWPVGEENIIFQNLQVYTLQR